jgi:hypothetical protein
MDELRALLDRVYAQVTRLELAVASPHGRRCAAVALKTLRG